MKRIVISFVIYFSIISLANSTLNDVESLIKDFTSNDWVLISDAKERLENLQEKALPFLFDLLSNDTKVSLENTGDLIYPGAKRFYGHGQIIEYDIDNISIRAGWLIEQITFQNFGFSYIHDVEEKLFNHIKNNFGDMLNSDELVMIKSYPADKQREIIKKYSKQKAISWWKKNKNNWKRFEGLKEALKSDNIKRQVLALQYLRKGTSNCEGLNKATYKKQIHVLVVNLAKSNIQRVAEQAKFLIIDNEYSFIDIKD